MQPMTRVSAVAPAVVLAQTDGSESLTDSYIGTGKVGARPLSSACYTWHDILAMVAIELWRRGEAEHARVMLKAAGGPSVRQFLLARFGIVTGSRQFWHRENWTPDRADLQEFLRAIQENKSRSQKLGC
jgi:hypothetical protein